MAKKQGIDDIISGISEIMPPVLNNKNKLATKQKAGVRHVEARKSEKITSHPLGTVIFEKSYSEGLIRRLEIKSWGTEFDFYGDFAKKAKLYFNHYEPRADYAPFFSFTPQYGHFNQKQLDYYSLWRENVRHGRYIKTDFSYVLLFIYEIINLTPELVAPKDGRRMLAGIWKNYRDLFLPLDKYLSEWMCDYCLVHGLACPHGDIDPFLDDILKKTTFPEFYLNRYPVAEARAMLLRSKSGYSSKEFERGGKQNREIFDRHINSALCSMMDGVEEKTASVNRDSYVGALCLYERKRRMTIDVIQLFESKIDEKWGADAVKYAENMVNMGLGMGSRHKNVDISSRDKRKMDQYFAYNYLKDEQAEKLKMELNDEKYAPISQGFSSSEAKAIEEDSREVIHLLGEAPADDSIIFEEDAQQPAISAAEELSPLASPFSHAVAEDEGEEPGELVKEGLRFIYNHDGGGLADYASSLSMLPEAVIEEINYFAFMQNGDIIVEEKDGEYYVIEEYKEIAEKWLKIKYN